MKDIKQYLEETNTVLLTKEAFECLKERASAIDKIRAEIEGLDGKYVIGDYGIYGENSPRYVRLWNVLQIINKYTVESEDKNDKC